VKIPLRLALILVMALAGAASADRQPLPDDQSPRSPGVHYLKFDFEYDGETESRPYGVWVPEAIESAKKDGRKLPLVITLGGRGSLGLDYRNIYGETIIGRLARHKQRAESVNFIAVRPLSPPDVGWEDKKTGAYVAEVTRRVIEHYPVDPKRVHIIGMSMGAGGTWFAAEAGPELYATVVSLSGRQHPEPAKIAGILKDRTTVIVVGEKDNAFTTGSQAMADALNAVDADVHHLVIPGMGHGAYGRYLFRLTMYEWMLKHRLGSKPPTDRANDRQMFAWAFQKSDDAKYERFSEDLQEELQSFAEYWWVESCYRWDGAGLHDKKLGRDDVFVTSPLHEYIPCRVMITADVPGRGKPTLLIDAASARDGQWKLTVNVDGKEQLSAIVEPKGEGDDAQLWHHYEVDLTRWAGKKAFVEVINERGERKDARAFWGRIEIRKK